MSVGEIRTRLRRLADPEKAKILQGFFRTGPGQYGEGESFLGVAVPVLRKLAREYQETPVGDALELLKSAVHEERLLALLLLVRAFARGDRALKENIYRLYCRNIRFINNWDLVDLSAPNIVGAYLSNKSRKPLYTFARSRDLWKRRIAVIATFTFIRQGDYDDTLKIARILLTDEHDLVHKAVGWMLREVGKRNLRTEEAFLQQEDTYARMPRTMLRYAIERFPEWKRKRYMSGRV